MATQTIAVGATSASCAVHPAPSRCEGGTQQPDAEQTQHTRFRHALRFGVEGQERAHVHLVADRDAEEIIERNGVGRAGRKRERAWLRNPGQVAGGEQEARTEARAEEGAFARTVRIGRSGRRIKAERRSKVTLARAEPVKTD